MKVKNKFVFGVCLLLIAFIIGGFSLSQNKKDVYNDDTIIAQEGDSFTYKDRIGNEDSNNNINIKYSEFSGTEILWNIETEEDSEILINYHSVVESGDFKAVLINSSKEIENILIGSQQGDKTIKLSKGKYIFKIIGRNANGEITISINEDQKIKFQKIR